MLITGAPTTDVSKLPMFELDEKILNQGALHVNAALTNMTVGVDQADDMFAAMQASPRCSTPVQHNRYYIWNRADMLRNDAVEGSAGKPAPLSQPRLSNSDFFCKKYHLASIITEEDRKNADPAVSLEETLTRRLVNTIKIKMESVWAANAFAVNKWGDDDTGAANGGGGDFVFFDDYTNSVPISYLKGKARTLARGIGKRRRDLTGVCNRAVMDVLEEHPNVLGKYEFVREGIMDDSDVAKALGIKKIIVSDAAYATSNPVDDATDSSTTTSFILGNHFLLTYAAPSPAIMEPSGSYTFSWDMDGVSESGFRVSSWDHRGLDMTGTILLVEAWFDPKVTAPGAGVFCSGAVSNSIT